ncbi:hypothetical protein OB2597_04123 [Pseudooceanicola batsensis HTCC2597]|uniref:DUF1223 domain-containing protein n=1 Tax=Pseudooceanicola batsensis (strain ATCC BAA-863 / DSM 15984 / KCTC 12145 / HTCC2597) TaxID=252305 RepID=A3U2M1_PSEBH|nr:hypothetical protein OB2597_04123 [Pseudooceanicola batsensis HTCC2597]
MGFATDPRPARSQEDTPVVVELYTSQGCSSCPPADAFLSVLAPREDVIALGLHVDYWDYIGWKDVFGSPEFSARQKAYAKAAGRRSVYTPQMIIGGEADVVGNHPMDVTDLIDSYRDRPVRVHLTLERRGPDRVGIDAEAVDRIAGPLLVQIVRYVPEAQVEIQRGENAGHKLSYSNIVTDWDLLAEWDAQEPYKAEIEVPGDKPVVVLIQQAGPGPIEAAARLR